MNDMLTDLKTSKINPEKNNTQVSMIKSGLKELEKEIEDPNEMVYIV